MNAYDVISEAIGAQTVNDLTRSGMQSIARRFKMKSFEAALVATGNHEIDGIDVIEAICLELAPSDTLTSSDFDSLKLSEWQALKAHVLEETQDPTKRPS